MSRIEKTKEDATRSKKDFLNNLYHSPFKEDRRWMIRYLAVETRDRLEENRSLVDQIFFKNIFEMMLGKSSSDNALLAFDIVCNLIKDK